MVEVDLEVDLRAVVVAEGAVAGEAALVEVRVLVRLALGSP